MKSLDDIKQDGWQSGIDQIWNCDCLEGMKYIPDNSIDMILADLPYGITACKWDTIIPFEPLWEQYKKIIKDNGAIVLTGSEPFASFLRVSNIKMYKYDWIWEKSVGSNFATLKYQPMKEHESISIFGRRTLKYNPIKEERSKSGKERIKYGCRGGVTGEATGKIKFKGSTNCTYGNLRYPRSIQKFNNREKCRGLHPTQKPVAMCEYFIKTYTNEGDLVLDNVIGSGTTAIACINTKRHFIGMEISREYCKISEARLSATKFQGELELK